MSRDDFIRSKEARKSNVVSDTNPTTANMQKITELFFESSVLFISKTSLPQGS